MRLDLPSPFASLISLPTVLLVVLLTRCISIPTALAGAPAAPHRFYQVYIKHQIISIFPNLDSVLHSKPLRFPALILENHDLTTGFATFGYKHNRHKLKMTGIWLDDKTDELRWPWSDEDWWPNGTFVGADADGVKIWGAWNASTGPGSVNMPFGVGSQSQAAAAASPLSSSLRGGANATWTTLLTSAPPAETRKPKTRKPVTEHSDSPWAYCAMEFKGAWTNFVMQGRNWDDEKLNKGGVPGEGLRRGIRDCTWAIKWTFSEGKEGVWTAKGLIPILAIDWLQPRERTCVEEAIKRAGGPPKQCAWCYPTFQGTEAGKGCPGMDA